MPERGIYRTPSIKGYATPTNAPIRVDPTSQVILFAPAGSGTTEIAIPTAISASGARIAAGTGTLVSGAATVPTGLTSILSFQCNISQATGFATGATEVTDVFPFTITTGSVVVKGIFNTATGAGAISASGTGTFSWIAVGM